MEGCGLPVFDGEGYEIWSKKMMTLFQSLQLWDLVEKGYKEDTTDKGFIENKMKVYKALYIIQQGVSVYIFSWIAKAKTSKEAWETIKNGFDSDDEDDELDDYGKREDHAARGPSRDNVIEDHVTIRMEEMLEMFDSTLESEKRETSIIFKVPDQLLRGNEKFYKPKVVAIGPNHRDNPKIASMEKLKMSYLKRLLKPTAVGSEVQKVSLESLVKAVRSEVRRVRTCYGESTDSTLTDDKLVQMIVLDGCFIIELLRDFENNPNLFRRISQKRFDNYFFRFAIRQKVIMRHNTWMKSADILYITAFQNDLLLMDNQIPFFIIKTLYRVINSGKDSLVELGNLTSRFLHLKYGMPQPLINMNEFNNDNCHLLYIAHKTLCSFKREKMVKTLQLEGDQTYLLNSATMLEKANVKFMAGKSQSIFEITFNKRKLRIPCFYIDDQFEIEIRNFIALELRQQKDNRYYCDYVVFMDHLIASPDDVDLLIRCKIITNDRIDANFVKNMFMNLSKKVVRSNPYTYSDISRELNHYYFVNRNTLKANFKQNYVVSFKEIYLKSPWAFISVVAASILLLLTLTQTVFTIIK